MLDLPHGPGPRCPSPGTVVIKPNGESGRKLYSFAVCGSAKGEGGKPGATRRAARHKSSGWLGGTVCATFNDRNSSLTVSPDTIGRSFDNHTCALYWAPFALVGDWK